MTGSGYSIELSGGQQWLFEDHPGIRDGSNTEAPSSEPIGPVADILAAAADAAVARAELIEARAEITALTAAASSARATLLEENQELTAAFERRGAAVAYAWASGQQQLQAPIRGGWPALAGALDELCEDREDD
jgi:hypothetical protein